MSSPITQALLPRTAEVRSTLGWRAPLLIFIGLFLIFAATSTRGVASTDDHASAVEGWRIASAGTPWLEGTLGGGHIQANEWLHQVPNGHVVADRMAGAVLISVPFYLLLDRDSRPSAFTIVPGGIAAAFLTAGTGLLIFLALRRRLGSLVSAVLTAAFALGTPTWSVSADGPWTHTVTQFGIAGAAYASSRRSWWLAGAFLGIGMLGRPHLALVALVLGLGMSWSTRSFRPAVGVALPCLGALGFLALWDRWMFGVWSIASSGYSGHAQAALGGSPVYSEFTGFQSRVVNYLGFFVAPDRGLFIWTPVILLLIPAIVRSRRRLPNWSWWLALGGILYTVMQLQMADFSGGGSFYGYRHGLELVTCLTPLCGFATVALGRLGQLLSSGVAAMQVGAIAVGAATSALFVQATSVWRDNALFMAMRALPGPLLAWLAFCGILGMLMPGLITRWSHPHEARVGRYGHDPLHDD